MGYTHYWKITERLDKDWDKWTSFLPDAMKIISHASQKLDIALADALGETKGEATVSLSGVSLNGYGEDSHESFVLTAEITKFDFCKTAQKPYDRVVVAILILATEYFGNDIEVTSDGHRAELLQGYYLFRSSMQREPRVTIENHKLTAWQTANV
jgi:hypothetical protein